MKKRAHMVSKAAEINDVIAQLLKKFPHCRGNIMNWATKKEPPFKVLIGTILSQRTKDINSARAVKALFARYGTPQKLAKAPLKEIEKLIRIAGPYHQKAHNIKATCKILVEKYKGKVPDTEPELLALPGVGQKTCDCVLLYGYGKAVIPVDVHVHRLSNLFGWVKTKKPEQTKHELENIVKGPKRRVVNCLLVSLGQATRYKKERFKEHLGPRLYAKYFE